MNLNKRWAILLSLLVGSAGLVLFAPPAEKEGQVVAAVARPGQNSARAPTNTRVQTAEGDTGMILAIRARKANDSFEDAFALLNWTPPPPPPPPQVAMPAKPMAPAMPFTFLGKKLEEGNWQVFLAKQDRTYVVRAQDTIEGDYRVESIAPPSLVLTYLPLQERQTLAIGGAN